ncbi:MAG: hypothetical protein NTW19_10205 [Planctomycetota bacterium]|nr:hypothetical protein [Planctomycetota bacterium]
MDNEEYIANAVSDFLSRNPNAGEDKAREEADRVLAELVDQRKFIEIWAKSIGFKRRISQKEAQQAVDRIWPESKGY